MKRYLLAATLLLSLLQSALAQINLQDVLDSYQPIIATCDVTAPQGSEVQYTWKADDTTHIEQTDIKAKVHGWAPPGKHWLRATVVVQTFQEIVVWVPSPEAPSDITKAKLQSIKIQQSFNVNDFEKKFEVKSYTPSPQPNPPPGPVPNPPGPAPPPTPVPGSISVLITYESMADFTKPELTPYLDVLNSTRLRDYLNTHTAKRSDGKPEWRQFDVNTPMQGESPKWQEAMKLPRTNDFWIVISNGSAGYSGPLPKSEEEILTLVRQWGGP